MSKLPTDYTKSMRGGSASDTGESQPLKEPKAKNASGIAWHGFSKAPVLKRK